MFPFAISSTYLFFENSCAVLSDEFDIFLLQVHVGNALKWKIKISLSVNNTEFHSVLSQRIEPELMRIK